ncbi:MAG TPA: hypothetical protein VF552_10050 [Allosphingosinicella sp.]|jgi:hypothetical protein
MARDYAAAACGASGEIALAQQGPFWTFFGCRQAIEKMTFLPRLRICVRFTPAETDEVAIRAVPFVS